MKHLLFSMLMLASFSLTANNPETGDTKTINIDESTVVWTGKKVTGSHTGTIKIKSGALEFTEGMLSGGSFTIDMGTIACTDLEGGSAQKLEGHLKSDDFFGVETNPTSQLTITNVAKGQSTGTYDITGDLTIKGITQPITFTAQVGSNMATAKVTIDRTKFNVRYGSGSFFDGLGDKMIYDEFDLDLNLKY